ncbi:MAG: hypothetical protein AAGH15_03355 [Myxococcota bacterium]
MTLLALWLVLLTSALIAVPTQAYVSRTTDGLAEAIGAAFIAGWLAQLAVGTGALPGILPVRMGNEVLAAGLAPLAELAAAYALARFVRQPRRDASVARAAAATLSMRASTAPASGSGAAKLSR